MSGTTVQINNADSGTVYITDDAAVEASLLDWLNRQDVAAADTIPEPLEPISSAQPKGKYKGEGKGKGEMKGGSPIVGQSLPVNAEGSSDRARARSRSPPRASAITPTLTLSRAATAAPTTAPTPDEFYEMAPQTPPLTRAVAEVRWTPPTPMAILDSDPNDNDWHSNGVV